MGRCTRSFLHQECWSLLTSCYSQFFHKADVGISRLAFNAQTSWTVRTDGKRPDSVAMVPGEMGKQLVWDVTVVHLLPPSRLNQGSLCNPGTAATEAEARKIEK